MAGNYPDVPGPRLAYDRDGSLGFQINTDDNSIHTLTSTEMQSLNDEGESNISAREYSSHASITGIIFPELRDIVGYFIAYGPGGQYAYQLQTSVDTTSGLDGTWVTITPGALPTATPVSPNYRTAIQAVSLPGIRAIRWSGGAFFDNTTYWAFHLYGKITSGETPDRLRLWHPTLDQPLDDQDVSPDGAFFDWGNVPQDTTADITFRIKNNSGTLTANNVLVKTEALSDTTPSVSGQHTLSQGSGFAATQTITAIAAGAISPVLTLRRNTPSDAVLGLFAARIVAAAASWS